MLLLQIPQYPSSSRLALLGTRRKYSVRKPFGALGTALLGTTLLAGCTSPNTYATARTLAPGDFTHAVAVEGIAHHGSQGTGALPVLPTYVLRVGVADRVDVGARIGSLTELGADIKFNFVRGPVDLALALGGEAFLEWRYEPDGVRRSGSRAYFHLPLIVSYNVSKKLSLVATPGVAYVIGRQVSDDFVRTQPFDGGTLAARLGLGIDYRWNKRRAIHPEVTVLQSTTAFQTIVVFGLGFNFGSIPNYDDVEPTPIAPTPAPPPRATPAEPPATIPAETPASPPPPETPASPPPPETRSNLPIE